MKADWSRSEQATVEADLAEADYVDAELAKILDGQILIGGKKIEVADIAIDCDEQSLFTDEDVVKLLRPKLRRLLQQKLLKDGKEADKRKAQKQAQKAVERERVQKALNQLSESWRQYLDASLLTSSRAQILAQLQPGVQGKQRKVEKKTVRKAVSCSVLQTTSLG